MSRRGNLPSWFLEAPELQPGLELYWNAFWDLSSCRHMGDLPGPIPWTAIVKYAEVYMIGGQQKYDLLDHIGAMDAFYLKYLSDQFQAKHGKS